MLHRLRRGDPQQSERVGERRLGRGNQCQPRGRAIGLRLVDYAGVAVEGVERRGQLGA